MASKIQFSKLSPVQQQVLLNFQVDPTTFYSKGNSAWRDYVGANSSFRKDLWDRLDDSQREAISRYNPKALNDSEMQSVINSSIRRATERVAPYVAAAVSMPAATQIYSALAKSGELAYAPISRLLSTPVGQALSKTAQVGFAIDAAERLADREGIAKTANKIKDGDVVGAIKSGTGDLLDITMVTPGLNAARPVIKSIPNIFAPLNKKLIIYNNKKFVDRINNAFPQYEKIELSDIDLANTNKVNKIIKKRILQDNTFVRGVRDAKREKDRLATDRILKKRYGILNPTAEDRMKFYATHYAPFTGAGRAGLDFPYEGALYTSNSINFAKAYGQPHHYGEKTGGIAVVRMPLYFSLNRNNWLKDNYRKLMSTKNFSELYSPTRDKSFDDLLQREIGTKNYRTIKNYEKEISRAENENNYIQIKNIVKQKVAIENKLELLRNEYEKYKKLSDNEYEKYKNAVLEYYDKYGKPNTSLIAHFPLIDFYDKKVCEIVEDYNRTLYSIHNLDVSIRKIKEDAKRIIKDKYNPFFKKMEQDFIFSTESPKFNNLYNHYIFLGKPNEKALDLIKFTPLKDVSKQYSRLHEGTNTKGLSQKLF